MPSPGASIYRGVSALRQLGEAVSEPECKPVGIHQVCENPPNRSKHHACNHVSRIVCADVDPCEADEGGDRIQAQRRPEPQLEMVDEERHQEENLGRMAAGKGIASFPPADDTRLVKRQEWPVPIG